jgi:TonB family protein
MSGALAHLTEPFTLVAPPRELTQTAPNQGKVGKDFNLESLLPRPRVFTPPSVPLGAPPVALPEPPKLDAMAGEMPPLGQAPAGVRLPLPQIQPEERPKLALETQGAPKGLGTARQPAVAGVPTPGKSVSEMARSLARGRNTGAQIVEDFGPSPDRQDGGLTMEPSRGRTGSSLELLSDPRGVDFKPYLIRILASVKRNWTAVIPESARMGRRGRAVVQFIINRDGTVPKLVIATPSGTEALDRAAVAGISATNPFPPLPAEFRGESVRLQFVFLYNMQPN